MMTEGGAADAAPPAPENGFERFVERLATLLAVFGGIILIGLALLVRPASSAAGSSGREITGAFEIVQVGVAVAAFLFLPICQLHNAATSSSIPSPHALPPRLRAGLDAFWALAYAAIALVLAWRLSLGAAETLRSHMVTPMLRIPVGWGMVVGTAALCFLALVSLLVAIRHLRGAMR